MRRLLSDQRGFTIVEALAAALIVGVGLVASAGAIDGGRSLSSFTAKKQVAARYAEQEIEVTRSLGWAALRMSSAPATPPPANGGTATATTYAAPGGGATEPLVLAAGCTGCVTPTGSWSDGNVSGKVWRFVTQAKDTLCGSACTSTVDRKRITIVVSIDGPRAPVNPIVMSTYVINAGDVPANTNSSGNPVQSSGGASIGAATGTSYYLTDSPIGITYLIPGIDHVLRDTASTVTGTADQLRTQTPGVPTDPAHLHLAYTYSTDSPPGLSGGLAISPSSACSSVLKANAHMWATPVLSATSSTTVTGNAALSLSSYTIGGITASAKLCVTILDVLVDSVTGKTLSATALGNVSYTLPAWPTTPEALTFPFRFLAPNTSTTLPALHRLGVRLSVDAAGGAGVSVVYDHPDFASYVQLETK